MGFKNIAISTVLASGALVACTTSNPYYYPDGGGATAPVTRTDSCMNFGWRQPTPGGVICPGTSSCECTGTDVCCVGTVDSKSGVCESAGKCRTLELACDGPEDCNTMTAADVSDASVDASEAGAPDAGKPIGKVCCLDEAIGTSGGGSSCKLTTACTGKILCRSDDDCVGAPNGLNRCRPVDYGTPGVEDRGLDGLLGYCTK